MTLSVLQHASNTAAYTSGTSATPTATFGSNTTPGSCLVACVTVGTPYTPSVTGVTTNGTAENWAVAVADSGDAIWMYADPNTGGGQTVIDVPVTFGGTASTSNGVAVQISIFEIAGIVTASPVDKTQVTDSFSSNTTSWSSGATATTTVANEMWIGAALVLPPAGSTSTVTGPSSPWTNETVINSAFQQGGTSTGDKCTAYQIAGYQVVSSTGAATYAGTVAASSYWAGAVITLKGAAASTLPGRVLITTQAVKRAAYY